MKKILILISIVLLLNNCLSLSGWSQFEKLSFLEKFTGTIRKIDTLHSFYVIYASSDSILVKLLVEKEHILKECNVISLDSSYDFLLESNSHRLGIKEYDNGTQSPFMYAKCMGLKNNDKICIEPENNIFEIYYVYNIRGYCYSSPNQLLLNEQTAYNKSAKYGWSYCESLSNKHRTLVFRQYKKNKLIYNMLHPITGTFIVFNSKGRYLHEIDFEGNIIQTDNSLNMKLTL